MYRMSCMEVWGGNQNTNSDIRSQGLTAAVFSNSSDGGKGGDVYYFSVCGMDMLTRIAIADVVGHGQEVSDVSQWVYNTIKKQISNTNNSLVLSNINQLAHERGFQAMTTAAVISYFTKTGHLSYAYAGHPPFLWRSQKKQWQRLDVNEQSSSPANLPLGIMANVLYDQDYISVSKGDRFVVYTDGVIESANSEEELFGQERLLQVLTEGQNDSLPMLKERIIKSLLEYTNGSLTHDDVTFMAVEIN
ncbi:MAG: serine/threonine-protein phosphatase [Acidobacteria bacterium]|nr:serine/threonine-protein phosphatase [Acidobacteriota bacterium]